MLNIIVNIRIDKLSTKFDLYLEFLSNVGFEKKLERKNMFDIVFPTLSVQYAQISNNSMFFPIDVSS